MKVKDLIYRIQSLYNKGLPSDDNRLSNRLIYNKFLTIRSKLISQEVKKKQRLSRWNYHTIPCIELIEVTSHECPCLPPVGCAVLRSKHKLPKPLSGLNGHIIESVTTIDKSIRIDETTLTAVKYQKGNKYTANKLSFYIHNDYLYINTPTDIRVVTLTGLFEDPTEVKLFENFCKENNCKDCDNQDCIDYLEEEFPIDQDMIETMIEVSLQELINIFRQGLEDYTSDSKSVNNSSGK